jgi:hypothetical protein
MGRRPMIESISAITLANHDMSRNPAIQSESGLGQNR